MRTVSADMNASLRSQSATLARVWKFTRRDGVELRFTDHDQAIVVPGDGTYRANIGFTATAAVCSATNFGSQQCEVNMSMTDDGMKEADVRARKWAGSDAIHSVVDWANPTSTMAIFSGTFGRMVITEKSNARIEILGLGSSTINLANDTYSMTCRNSLGDKKCLKNIENLRRNFTVVTILDPYTFVANDLGGLPDGYFALGQLVWDTGTNAGDALEVQTSLNLTNEVGLYFPPAAPVQAGDTGHLYPGCDLLIATCHDKFDNVINFNGEPYNVQPRIISAPPSTGSPTPGGGALLYG